MSDLYTTGEAAAALGVSTRTVRREARRLGLGRLHSGIWIFTAADLERLPVRRPGRPRGPRADAAPEAAE